MTLGWFELVVPTLELVAEIQPADEGTSLRGY
jgi:hypothetical protein